MKSEHLVPLAVAAVGGSAASWFAFTKQWIPNPWLAFGLALAIVLITGFVLKVWDILQEKWSKDSADWLDRRGRILISGYRKRYLQQMIYRHRSFDVKGLTTQSVYSLEIEQVFVELATVRK